MPNDGYTSPTPLNILVVGAKGRAGQLVTEYALHAGHKVTGFSRKVEAEFPLSHPNLCLINGDVLNIQALENALQGQDAVISTLGSMEGEHSILHRGMRALVIAMESQGIKRIIALGGAGILNTPAGDFRYLEDGFPENLRPVTEAHLEAYRHLVTSELDWTLVAPPLMPDGEPTGQYRHAMDVFPEGARPEVSTADVADFIIRELDESRYLRRRAGIGAAASA